MLIAYNEKNEEIFADDAQKKRNYTCRFCKKQLILKKGIKKIPHFAHKSHSACLIKTESYEHQLFKFICKQQLSKLTKFDIRPENAFYIDNELRIADIFIKQLFLIIEFQHTNISQIDWNDRTKFYKKLGKETIWVFDKRMVHFDDKEEYVKIPFIIKYLRKFYPIYLFDAKNPYQILRLVLGQNKFTWVEEFGIHGGYARKNKTFFEYTIQELTWLQLIQRGITIDRV